MIQGIIRNGKPDKNDDQNDTDGSGDEPDFPVSAVQTDLLCGKPLQYAAKDDGKQKNSAPDGPTVVRVSVVYTGRIGAEYHAGQKADQKTGSSGQGKAVFSKYGRKYGQKHGEKEG